MNMKDFWMDVLRSAAVVGVAMSLSHILEQYVLVYSTMDVATATLLVAFEALVAAAGFVAMHYYFVRRVAKQWHERLDVGEGRIIEVKFTYGRALSYVLMVSMLAGVIVGVANTLYTDMQGYDLYISSILERFDELLSMPGLLPEQRAAFDEFTSLLESSEAPSIFENILSYVNTYMFFGGITGFAVAYVARRNLPVRTE